MPVRAFVCMWVREKKEGEKAGGGNLAPESVCACGVEGSQSGVRAWLLPRQTLFALRAQAARA
eukprot:6184873-Pleurochrysis_carterae.AAC.1